MNALGGRDGMSVAKQPRGFRPRADETKDTNNSTYSCRASPDSISFWVPKFSSDDSLTSEQITLKPLWGFPTHFLREVGKEVSATKMPSVL